MKLFYKISGPLFAQIQKFSAKKDVWYYLTGVKVEPVEIDGKFFPKITASDGHRIATAIDRSGDADPGAVPVVLLPCAELAAPKQILTVTVTDTPSTLDCFSGARPNLIANIDYRDDSIRAAALSFPDFTIFSGKFLPGSSPRHIWKAKHIASLNTRTAPAHADDALQFFHTTEHPSVLFAMNSKQPEILMAVLAQHDVEFDANDAWALHKPRPKNNALTKSTKSQKGTLSTF